MTNAMINSLWAQLEEIISRAAKAHDGDVLVDYAENSWHAKLDKLVYAETVNERQHRKGFGNGAYPVSAAIGAKILILSNVLDGARRLAMPPATLFMTIRPTAAESITLGYVLRHDLPREWCDQVDTLDYSEAMNPSKAHA